MGRIGQPNNGTMSDNKARDDMRIGRYGSEAIPTDYRTASDRNGADVSLGTAQSSVFSGWNTAVWDIPNAALIVNGALPVLKSIPQDPAPVLPGSSYTVVYHVNGGAEGTAPVDAGSPYFGGSTATVLDAGALERTGYTFAGWNTAANGSGTPRPIGQTFVITGNVTLYAQWTVNTYTVTFDANGGTVSQQTGTTAGAGWRLSSLPVPARTGYKFEGWFTEANGGDRVTTETAFSADATIYAQWSVIRYRITFNANYTGGTVTPAFDSTGGDRTLASLPELALDGYIFNGWFTAMSGGTEVTAGTEFSANATIYARWTLITYTITFNAGSGTVTPASGATGVGGRLASLPVPARTGYAFDGWFTAETGGTAVTTSTVFDANATIFARWTVSTYTVTFDANGGTVAPTSVTAGESGRLALLPTPTRDAYTFEGWFTAAAGGMQVSTNTVFDADAAVYARWTVSTYTVTFLDYDGKLLAAVTVSHGNDATASAPIAPSRAGQTFTGWSEPITGITSDLTVIAEYQTVAVLSNDRLIPPNDTGDETVIIAPVKALTAKFTAGPNPISKSSGKVSFFRLGKRVDNAGLTIYDLAGNVVNRININDNAVDGQGLRVVGSWDLKDRSGRVVSEGTYLVRGEIRTKDGGRERVSVMVGVR